MSSDNRYGNPPRRYTIEVSGGNPPNYPKELTRQRNRWWAKGADIVNKNIICLWYDHDAEAAARFYSETFPDSSVKAVNRAPSDYPGGKAGDVLTVDFVVVGIPCMGLNGGPTFKHNESFSFQMRPTIRQKRTATGMPSSATVVRKANVAGARTNGAYPGRSRPAY